MKHYLLNEIDLPTKLKVKFSDDITNLIEVIDFYNRFEYEQISEWHSYIKGLIDWISNTVIAWDNTNQYQYDYVNNITHIQDNGYDVTFVMNTNKSCIVITKVNLRYEEFGLKRPSLYENKSSQKCFKKKHTITESQLRSIIRETIKKLLRA